MSDTHKCFVELKEIKAVKELSGDIVVKIVLLTEDTNMLDLGKYPSDTLFELKISPSKMSVSE